MFEEIPDQVKELIEKRVFRNTPIKELGKNFNIKTGEVTTLLKKYDSYVAHIASERKLQARAKYHKLDKLAMTTIKEILQTPHVQPVMEYVDGVDGGEGKMIKTGEKLDVKILQLKKEVAEKVLENTGAKDKEMKGGGITVNTQNNNGSNPVERKSEKQIINDQKVIEVSGILDDCKLIDVDAVIVEND